MKAKPVRVYAIWVEGYIATGNSSKASQLGEAYGETFSEACASFFRDRDDAQFFRAGDVPMYWGCRLFDNEADARKMFG